MVYFSWLRESLYKQPSRGVDRCSVVVVNMASWEAVWCWSIARVEPDWGILNHLSKSPAFNSANFWERLSKRICTREFFFAASFFLIHRPKRVALPRTTTDTTTYMIHRPKRVATSQRPQPTQQLTWSIAQNVWHSQGPQPTRQLTWSIAQNVWQPPNDHNQHDNLHDPSPKTCGNLPTTTTDTTTYMIHRPKRVALPRTTTDTTTYMIHRPKRVATSQRPQPTQQLTWSIAQNVWQPPHDHNRHDNLHDPSPKTCGTPKDHNRHDNLHDPSPKTCGNLPTTTTDTTTYMIHRPKRVALPRTTTDTTTYMIHRPKRVATSQGPQPTRHTLPAGKAASPQNASTLDFFEPTKLCQNIHASSGLELLSPEWLDIQTL